MVYQQFCCWNDAGCFKTMVNDLRNSFKQKREMQRSPNQCGDSASLNHCKAHKAVDTMGQLVSLTITSANEQERSQIDALCEKVQEATGSAVDIA